MVPRGKSESAVPEMVIELLTDEWPLSLKGLHLRIRRRFAKEISYQAVHKAVRKMFKEDVLVMEGRHYKINTAWLGRLVNFSNNLISYLFSFVGNFVDGFPKVRAGIARIGDFGFGSFGRSWRALRVLAHPQCCMSRRCFCVL